MCTLAAGRAEAAPPPERREGEPGSRKKAAEAAIATAAATRPGVATGGAAATLATISHITLMLLVAFLSGAITTLVLVLRFGRGAYTCRIFDP